MTEIVAGLDEGRLDRVRTLRSERRFFWIDVSLGETSQSALRGALGLEERVLQTLVDFGDAADSSRRLYADGRQVVFGFGCYVALASAADEMQYRLSPIEVRLLVCGEYVLTLHQEPGPLPELLALDVPDGRGGQYLVYTILDAMVASAFDALSEIEQKMDNAAAMSTDLRGGRVRIASLRAVSARLMRMRRRVGAQRGSLERIGVELGWIEGRAGDTEPYFDRIGHQVSRLLSSIDAAAGAMATTIDLLLNETVYRLTVVATIFLPLTFITGFFGMNFDWMIGHVKTELAFWLLGVGSLVVGIALIWRLVLRATPFDVDEHDA